MRVYISGPIKGRPNANREAFDRAGIKIRELGVDAVNPHYISPDHPGRECVGEPTGWEGDKHLYGCYLRADIRELVDCDAYTVLEGWEDSLGANTEIAVARAIGLPQIGGL